MRYEFEARDGEVVELDFPIGEAPSIGATVRRGGRVLRRLPPRTQVPVVGTPITSHTLPSKTHMHPALRDHVSRWSDDDAPMFTSSGEARRYTEAEKRLCEAGELPTFHTYGDAPSCEEVREARDRGEKIRID